MYIYICIFFFFFFQAEDGIRDKLVTGVQTCSLPILLLPGSTTTLPESPFYAEVIDSHVGYLRLGSLTNGNLQAMDKKLGEFAGKKVDALVGDLRASSLTNDFAAAAEFAKRFTVKGKPLFTMRKTGARHARNFTSGA